jgi:hypothetical protein
MGPKKKGGKGGKLAKMTEEQRLIYMEQKLLEEEEARKQKEDMMSQFLKDKLAKEEKSVKFNLSKLQNQWRVIMRESKSIELRKNIEILSQTFERIVDRKDAILKSLVKDLDEAEEQYQMSLRSHLQNLHKLIDFQGNRLVKADEEYEEELDSLKDEFDTERARIITEHRQESEEIMDIIFAMEQEFEESEAEARSEFTSLRDEIKNKNLEDKHALRIQLEGQVEDLWKQFQAALKSYNESTEERKVAFETLKSKDIKSAQEIEQQMRKLQRIQDKIAQLKAKMSQNSRECEERNRILKEEREAIAVCFHQLKDQMNKFREQERSRLTTMTLQSNAAIKELKRKKETGERILKLAEMCRKAETEEEKVLPFYASSLDEVDQRELFEANQEKPSEPLAELISEYASLENFWKRYNKVLLDKLALDKENSALLTENNQLRSVLKQYLDGISVNEEILSQTNPLFIVNNKTNVKLSVPINDPRIESGKPQHTVVEAAHVVKHTI